MPEKPQLYVLKDYKKDGTYIYGKQQWKLPSEVERINREVAHNVSIGIYLCGFEWVPKPPKPAWYGKRHICRVRSICETMGIHPGKFHCQCGKVYNDPVHFKTKELEKMSPEEKLYL